MVILFCIEAFEIESISLTLFFFFFPLNGRVVFLVLTFSVIKPVHYLEVDLHMYLDIEKCGVSIHKGIFNAKPISHQLAPACGH